MYIWCTPLRQSKFELSEKKESNNALQKINQINLINHFEIATHTYVYTNAHTPAGIIQTLVKLCQPKHNLVFHTFGVTATFQNILAAFWIIITELFNRLQFNRRLKLVKDRWMEWIDVDVWIYRNASISKASLSESSQRSIDTNQRSNMKTYLKTSRLDPSHKRRFTSTNWKGTEKTRMFTTSKSIERTIETYEKQTSTTQESKAKRSKGRKKNLPSIHRCSKSTFDSFLLSVERFFIVFKRFYTLAAHSISKQQRILATYTGRVWCMFE